MKCEYDTVCSVGGESLNDWNFVMVTEKPGEYVAQEMSDIHQDALTERFAKVESEIKIGGFGVISCAADIIHAPIGIRLVRFTSKPKPLQESTDVEGSGNLPEGTMVVEAIFWDRVRGSPSWWQLPKEGNSGTPTLFWMPNVLSGNIQVISVEENGHFKGPPTEHLSWSNQNNKQQRENKRHLQCKYVGGLLWDDMIAERHVRQQMQIIDVAPKQDTEDQREAAVAKAKEKKQLDEKAKNDSRLAALMPATKKKKPPPPKKAAAKKPAAKKKPKRQEKSKLFPDPKSKGRRKGR
jgi:hypothetical protein